MTVVDLCEATRRCNRTWFSRIWIKPSVAARVRAAAYNLCMLNAIYPLCGLDSYPHVAECFMISELCRVYHIATFKIKSRDMRLIQRLSPRVMHKTRQLEKHLGPRIKDGSWTDVDFYDHMVQTLEQAHNDTRNDLCALPFPIVTGSYSLDQVVNVFRYVHRNRTKLGYDVEPWMLDRKTVSKHFVNNSTCDICLDNKALVRATQLRETESWQRRVCQHVFCETCLVTHIQEKYTMGAFLVPCPFLNCNAHLYLDDVVRIGGIKLLKQCPQQRACLVCNKTACKCSQPHHIRLCPTCRNPIAKNKGCDIMTCVCGTQFYWSTGQAREGFRLSVEQVPLVTLPVLKEIRSWSHPSFLNQRPLPTVFDLVFTTFDEVCKRISKDAFILPELFVIIPTDDSVHGHVTAGNPSIDLDKLIATYGKDLVIVSNNSWVLPSELCRAARLWVDRACNVRIVHQRHRGTTV